MLLELAALQKRSLLSLSLQRLGLGLLLSLFSLQPKNHHRFNLRISAKARRRDAPFRCDVKLDFLGAVVLLSWLWIRVLLLPSACAFTHSSGCLRTGRLLNWMAINGSAQRPRF
jgi:hypothetical protein